MRDARVLESPSSGVTTHILSSLTKSAPFATIGVRVILHVWVKVPMLLSKWVSDSEVHKHKNPHVVIFRVVVTITGDVNLVSCSLGNTFDV